MEFNKTVKIEKFLIPSEIKIERQPSGPVTGTGSTLNESFKSSYVELTSM